MSHVIQPIQTRAYGHLFRSRVEARWAVFFETLGLKWEYEPEGFLVDDEPYLPDFRITTPQGGVLWVEVKGSHVQSDPKFDRFKKAIEEQARWIGDGSDTVIRANLVSGSPKEFLQDHFMCYRCSQFLKEESGYRRYNEDVGSYCFECDMETPGGSGNAVQFDGFSGCGRRGFRALGYVPYKGDIVVPLVVAEAVELNIEEAVEVAMSARFEHGEAPS